MKAQEVGSASQQASLRRRYLGKLHRARWFVILGCLGLAGGLGVVALGAVRRFSDLGFVDRHADSTRTELALTRHLNFSGSQEVLLLFKSSKYRVSDPEFHQAYVDTKASLQHHLPLSYGYLSWFDFPFLTSHVSKDGHKAFAHFQLKDKVPSQAIKDAATPPNPDIQVMLGGFPVLDGIVSKYLREDLGRAEVLSLPIILIIMVFTFESVVAALCPLLVAMNTIVWSLALMGAFSLRWRISEYAPELVTMMGLGLSIDYSLFIVSRFMSERRKRPAPADVVAVMDTVMSTSGRTVMFSGVTMAISMAGAFVFHEFYLGSLSLAIICVAASACITCIVLLPAVLFCLDHHIFRLPTTQLVQRCKEGLGRCFRCQDQQNELSCERRKHGLWYHIAQFSMRHAWAVLLPALACFIALAALFFARLRLGYADENVLPVDSPPRVMSRVIQANFPELSKSNVEVYLRTKESKGVVSRPFLEELDAFTAQAEQIPGVISITCQVRDVAGPKATIDDYINMYHSPSPVALALKDTFQMTDLDRTSRMSVTLQHGPYTKESAEAVEDIRDLLYSSFGRSPTVAEFGTTSSPAYFVDLIDDLKHSIPVWASVMGLSVLLLVLLMTTSPFLAAKAVLTSALSLGASFGLIVLFFQEGVGKMNGLGVVPCGYLDGLQLIYIFNISFGLSVDYELFVLSSIQEAFAKTGNHREAIAIGIDRAGRNVSQAALLLAIVTGSFVFARTALLKMIGFGIAVSVLIDATIVRSCLVPTILVLAGEKVVWWAPAWLKRLVGRLGLEEKWQQQEEEEEAAAAADDKSHSASDEEEGVEMKEEEEK